MVSTNLLVEGHTHNFSSFETTSFLAIYIHSKHTKHIGLLILGPSNFFFYRNWAHPVNFENQNIPNPVIHISASMPRTTQQNHWSITGPNPEKKHILTTLIAENLKPSCWISLRL